MRPIGTSIGKVSAALSSITTDPRATPSPTSAQHGGHGVVTLSASELAAMEPLEAERAAMASLPPPVASLLRWNETSLFDGDGQFTGSRFRAEFKGPVDLDALRAALTPWLRPLESAEIVKRLAELRLLVRRQNNTGEDMNAQAALFAHRLQDYPADVVRHVLRKWADREEWWPSWAELKAQCDRYSKRRMALKALL